MPRFRPRKFIKPQTFPKFPVPTDRKTPPAFGNPKFDEPAPPDADGGEADGRGTADGGTADGAGGDGEAEVLITPRAAVLDELQVTEDEFEWALGRCLDLLEEAPDDEEPAALEEVEIILNGRTFRLGEVAEIEFGGDLSELGPLPELDGEG